MGLSRKKPLAEIDIPEIVPEICRTTYLEILGTMSAMKIKKQEIIEISNNTYYFTDYFVFPTPNDYLIFEYNEEIPSRRAQV